MRKASSHLIQAVDSSDLHMASLIAALSVILPDLCSPVNGEAFGTAVRKGYKPASLGER